MVVPTGIVPAGDWATAKEDGLEVAGYCQAWWLQQGEQLSAGSGNLRRLHCVGQWSLFSGLPLLRDSPPCQQRSNYIECDIQGVEEK